MRLVGRLHDWNDARGFGFVTPNGGGTRAFVHVRAFDARMRRPAEGDLVSYTVSTDAKGRANATSVRFAGASTRRVDTAPAATRVPATRVATLFALALAAAVAAGRIPAPVPAAYAAMSLVTYFSYLADKSAAVRGRRRTPEHRLHVLSLLGGWPGAAFAQQHFQHKRSKATFVASFRVTVVANLLLLVGGLALRAHPQWLP